MKRRGLILALLVSLSTVSCVIVEDEPPIRTIIVPMNMNAGDGKACRLYEHANFQGQVLSIRPGQSIDAFDGFWNDKVSSIKVPGRCTLFGAQHFGFDGNADAWDTGKYEYVGDDWNDQMSSATCECE